MRNNLRTRIGGTARLSPASRAAAFDADRIQRAPADLRLPAPAYVGLAVAGAVFGLALADSGLSDPADFTGFLDLVVGWSFIGVGLYAWWRRPSNRIGPLMTATGFFWFVASLGFSANSYVATYAGLIGVLYHATAIHLLLAFPSGRLRTRPAKIAALAGYLLFFGGNLAVYLVTDFRTEFACPVCAENLLQIVDNQTVADVVIKGANLMAAVLLGFVLFRQIVSWRQAEGWRRRAYTPLLFAAVATTFLLGLTGLALAFHVTVVEDVNNFAIAAFATVPYAFLIGLIRSRMLGGGEIGHLAVRIGEARDWGEVEDVLRNALGDPSLRLACRQSPEERWVAADGEPLAVPAPGDSRGFALVDVGGVKDAAFTYDVVLVDDPGLVAATATAASVAMHKHELEVELRAKLEELRASRERLVEASDNERRRLERNLHDGAQQRLVSLALDLRLARARLGSDPAAASDMLDAAGAELELALGELRELARGIHPAILSNRGLDAALGSLASRSPLAVEVRGVPDQRLPEGVEAAAYFVVSEALANTTKHSRAAHASIGVARTNGWVTVEVSDNGVGGADPANGTGLRGLGDRITALDGRLEIYSPPGAGTLIRASIPCE
jgi:signal transduction histidine kinase